MRSGYSDIDGITNELSSMNVTDLQAQRNSLCQSMLNIIQNRLSNDLSLDPNQVSLDIISHYIIPEVLRPDTYQFFINLTNNQETINDEDLFDYFDGRLKLFIREEKPLTVGQYYTYIRSWEITRELLGLIVRKLRSENMYLNVAARWENLLHINPELNKFYIRYVGSCKSPTTPWNRLVSDISRRSTGFLCRLFKVIQEVDESFDPIVNVRLFYLDTSLYVFSQQKIDALEESIVSLFGLGNLLNVKSGAGFSSYHPGLQSFLDYKNLDQDFFARYNSMKSNCGLNTYELKAQQWIQKVIEKSIDLPGVYWQQHCLEVTKFQATPSSMVGVHNLFCVIGCDVSKTSFYRGSVPFLDPTSSRAGYVICDHLSRLYQWQNGESKGNVASAETSFGSTLPYFDMLPWYPNDVKNIGSEALEQTTLYMNSLKPLLVLTLSRRVFSCAKVNFVHSSGLASKTRYVDQVGLPFVIRTAGVESESFLGIPHFDPGADRHQSKDYSIHCREIMDFTWQITFAIASHCLKIIETSPEIDRETLLSRLYEMCKPNSTILPTDLEILYHRLNNAKASYWRSLRDSFRAIPILDPEALTLKNREGFQKRNDRIGVAAGEAHSQEREAQAQELWEKNYTGDLHFHIPRSYYDQWKGWILKLKEGTSLLMSAVRYLRNADEGPNYGLLKWFREEDDGLDFEEWKLDDEKIQEAYSRWGAYCRSFHTDTTAPSSAEYSLIAFRRHEVKDPERFAYYPEMNGRRFRRQLKRVCRIYWLHQETGKKYKFELTLNKEPNAPKTIEDVMHDVIINIVDEGFRFDSLTMRGVSFGFSHDQMKLHKDSEALSLMWILERNRLGYNEPLPTVVQVVGAPFYNGSIDNGKKMYQVENSIGPHDAIFILREFMYSMLTPGVHQIFSFAPPDVFDNYLEYKNKTCNSGIQIIPFASTYSQFLETHFLNVKRREDSLIKLEQFDKSGLAGSTIFIKSIQMLFECEKKVVNYPTPKIKKKTTTELHFY